MPGFLFIIRLAGVSQFLGPASGQEPAPFGNLSLEQLSQIQIVTASKRPETLANTPSAVYVLSGGDIDRLGVTTLPDALRYIPGMDVAMINSSQWSVSARGFNGQYANQLLVMMDGRSIYNPSFGGVIWGAQDTFFEDIDRIEIVRGPGGALWGANAVNGVINIITKSAQDTQGTIFSAGGGTFQEAMTAARHGFKLSEKTFARVYVKYDRFGESPLASGGDTPDAWHRLQGGFRLDSLPNPYDTFTFQGDVHRVKQNFVLPFPSFTSPGYASTETYQVSDIGANLLGRWTRRFSSGSIFSAQAYYDSYEQQGPMLHQRLHTLDLEVQHTFPWSKHHTFNWGGNFRNIWDHIFPARILRVPGRAKANDQLFSLFGEDEIVLAPERLTLTVGAKAEHNDYTGWEYSPNVRFLWHPSKRQTAWSAVSRAVTTLNHLSTGVQYDLRILPPGALGPQSPATLLQLSGKADRVETLLAYEIGYRVQPKERISLDVATFYNDYAHLMVLETGKFLPGAPPILPVNWLNRIEGRTYGVETALGLQPLPKWRLQGGHTWFKSDVANGSIGRGDGSATPGHKFSIRSQLDFSEKWQWDTGWRYVSRLDTLDVPAYLELDFRLAWKPDRHWEIALVGQNLLHDSHFEFPRGLNPLKSGVSRSVYAKLVWRY